MIKYNLIIKKTCIVSGRSAVSFFVKSKGSRQKKIIFFSGRATKLGEGFGGVPLRKKDLIFFFKFVAFEKLNIFCLRRHIQILILVYYVVDRQTQYL